MSNDVVGFSLYLAFAVVLFVFAVTRKKKRWDLLFFLVIELIVATFCFLVAVQSVLAGR
jgi:ABC-type polysaccharide/polyol phosphate export permease